MPVSTSKASAAVPPSLSRANASSRVPAVAAAALSPRRGSGGHHRSNGMPTFDEFVYLNSMFDEDTMSFDSAAGDGLTPRPAYVTSQHMHGTTSLPPPPPAPSPRRPSARHTPSSAGPRLQQRRLSHCPTPDAPPQSWKRLSLESTNGVSLTGALSEPMPYDEIADVYGLNGGYAITAFAPTQLVHSHRPQPRAKAPSSSSAPTSGSDSRRRSSTNASSRRDSHPPIHGSRRSARRSLPAAPPVPEGHEGGTLMFKAIDVEPRRVPGGALGNGARSTTAASANASSSSNINRNALTDEAGDSIPPPRRDGNGAPQAPSAAVVPMAWRDPSRRRLSSPASCTASPREGNANDSVAALGTDSVNLKRRHSVPQQQQQQHPGGTAEFAELHVLCGIDGAVMSVAGSGRGRHHLNLVAATAPAPEARRTDSLLSFSTFHSRRARAPLDASMPRRVAAGPPLPLLALSRGGRPAPPRTTPAASRPAAHGTAASPTAAAAEAPAAPHTPPHHSSRPSAASLAAPARRLPGGSWRGRGPATSAPRRPGGDSSDDGAVWDYMDPDELSMMEVGGGGGGARRETAVGSAATSAAHISRGPPIPPERLAHPRQPPPQHQEQPLLSSEMYSQRDYSSFGAVMEAMSTNACIGAKGRAGAGHRAGGLLELNEFDLRRPSGRKPHTGADTTTTARPDFLTFPKVGAASSAPVNATGRQSRGHGGRRGRPSAHAAAASPHASSTPAVGRRLSSPRLDDSSGGSGGSAATSRTRTGAEEVRAQHTHGCQVPPRAAETGTMEEDDFAYLSLFDSPTNPSDATAAAAPLGLADVSAKTSGMAAMPTAAQRAAPMPYSSLFAGFGGSGLARPEALPATAPLAGAALRTGRHGSGLKAHYSNAFTQRPTDPSAAHTDAGNGAATAAGSTALRRSSLLEHTGEYDVHFFFSSEDEADGEQSVVLDGDDSGATSAAATPPKRRPRADDEDEHDEGHGTLLGAAGVAHRGGRVDEPGNAEGNSPASMSPLQGRTRASAVNVGSAYSVSRFSYGSRFRSLMPLPTGKEEARGSGDGADTSLAVSLHAGSGAFSTGPSGGRTGWCTWSQRGGATDGDDGDDDSDVIDNASSSRHTSRSSSSGDNEVEKDRCPKPGVHGADDASSGGSSAGSSLSDSSLWEGGSNFTMSREIVPPKAHPAAATTTAMAAQGERSGQAAAAAAAEPPAGTRVSPERTQQPSPPHLPLQHPYQEPPQLQHADHEPPSPVREVGSVALSSLRLLRRRGAPTPEASPARPQQRADEQDAPATPHPRPYSQRRPGAVVVPSLDPHLVRSGRHAYGGERSPVAPSRVHAAGAAESAWVWQQTRGTPCGAGLGVATNPAGCGGYTSPNHCASVASYQAVHAVPCPPPAPPRLTGGTALSNGGRGAAVATNGPAAMPVFHAIPMAASTPAASGAAAERRSSSPSASLQLHRVQMADRSGSTTSASVTRGDCASINSVAANEWLRQSQRAAAFVNERDLRQHGWAAEPRQDKRSVGSRPARSAPSTSRATGSAGSDEVSAESTVPSLQPRPWPSPRTEETSSHLSPFGTRWFMFVTLEIRWVPSPGLSPDERGLDASDARIAPHDFMLN